MAREALAGSMGNRGQVFREGDVVLRPVGPHTGPSTVLLEALAETGFPSPVPRGMSPEGEQRLGWIDGEVPAQPPFPEWSRTDAALVGVARLVRRYHDTVAGLTLDTELSWAREFADPMGGPLLCHNDICPPNVVFRDGAPVALLDFDYAAPGRAVWELAQMARMWLTLRPVHAQPRVGPEYEPFRRLRVLVDAYGLAPAEHAALVQAISDSWRVGMAFVQARALAGQAEYLEIWTRHEGEAGNERALVWLDAHHEVMLEALGAARSSRPDRDAGDRRR